MENFDFYAHSFFTRIFFFRFDTNLPPKDTTIKPKNQTISSPGGRINKKTWPSNPLSSNLLIGYNQEYFGSDIDLNSSNSPGNSGNFNLSYNPKRAYYPIVIEFYENFLAEEEESTKVEQKEEKCLFLIRKIKNP